MDHPAANSLRGEETKRNIGDASRSRGGLVGARSHQRESVGGDFTWA